MSRWRTTLSDPAVEPAEPPANMSAKSTMTVSGAAAVEARVQELGHQDGRAEHEQDGVQAELLVAGEDARTPADEGAVHESEVRAREDHERGDHPLRGCPERLDRARLRREATSRHGGERVRD